jgi:hypothetical protein
MPEAEALHVRQRTILEERPCWAASGRAFAGGQEDGAMNRDSRVTEVHAEPVIARTIRSSSRTWRCIAGSSCGGRFCRAPSAVFCPCPWSTMCWPAACAPGSTPRWRRAGRWICRPLRPPILADVKGQGVAAKLTFTAAAAVMAKFAGRKFLALVAAGRGAEEMAQTFTSATFFDHYCAKLHVGGEITAGPSQPPARLPCRFKAADVHAWPTLRRFSRRQPRSGALAAGSPALGFPAHRRARRTLRAQRGQSRRARRISRASERGNRLAGPRRARGRGGHGPGRQRAPDPDLVRAFEERWQGGVRSRENRNRARRLRSAARFASMEPT